MGDNCFLKLGVAHPPPPSITRLWRVFLHLAEISYFSSLRGMDCRNGWDTV